MGHIKFHAQRLKLFILVFGISLGGPSQKIQGQVGIGTTNPHPSALLDLASQDQGLLLPRVALKDATEWGLSSLGNAAPGLLVYHSADSLIGDRGLYVFDGALWRGLAFTKPDQQQWQWSNAGLHYGSGDVYVGSSASSNNDLWLSRRLLDWDNSNYYLDPGAGSVLNEIKLDQGSTADVSLYWNRPDTGFFAPPNGAMGFSVYGQLRWFLSSDGRFGINTNTPQADLDLNGTARLGAHGTIIHGIKHFTQTHSIPNDWTEETLTITMSPSELQILNIPESAHIQAQMRDAPSRELSILNQGMDQNGFYCTITGMDPTLLGQTFKLDFLALF